MSIVLLRYSRIKVDGRRQGNYRTLGDIGHLVMEYVIAILYKILDIGSRLYFIKIY